MGRKFWNIVLLMVLSSFIVCGHVYKDYTNNAVLLSSVYDAMKNNIQDNMRSNLNQYDMLSDTRNKRNVNEKVEYYDALPSEPLSEYVIFFRFQTSIAIRCALFKLVILLFIYVIICIAYF